MNKMNINNNLTLSPIACFGQERATIAQRKPTAQGAGESGAHMYLTYDKAGKKYLTQNNDLFALTRTEKPLASDWFLSPFFYAPTQ